MRGGKRSGAGRKPSGVQRVPFTARVTPAERAAILARFGSVGAAIRFLVSASAGEASAQAQLSRLPVPDVRQVAPAPPVVDRKETAQAKKGTPALCADCIRKGRHPSCPKCHGGYT